MPRQSQGRLSPTEQSEAVGGGVTAVPAQGLLGPGGYLFAVSEDKVQWCHSATLLWHLNHDHNLAAPCAWSNLTPTHPGHSSKRNFQPPPPPWLFTKATYTSRLCCPPPPAPARPSCSAQLLSPASAQEGAGEGAPGADPSCRGLQAHPGTPTPLPAPSCPAQEQMEVFLPLVVVRGSACSSLSPSPPSFPF